jgi:hypothetical protein
VHADAADPRADSTRHRHGRPTAMALELRRAGLTGIVLLAILNVADVATTQLLLNHGGIELNPLADRLLASNSILLVKLAIVGAFAYAFVHHGPRIITVCFLWLVAGVYLCVVVINGSQLFAVLDG